MNVGLAYDKGSVDEDRTGEGGRQFKRSRSKTGRRVVLVIMGKKDVKMDLKKDKRDTVVHVGCLLLQLADAHLSDVDTSVDACLSFVHLREDRRNT